MCYALYIGCDQDLPIELAGDSDNDRMWLRALDGRADLSAVGKFTKPHVYYAASWQDCGCGWLPDAALFERPSRRKRSQELTDLCLAQLRELVSDLLSQDNTVELYFTWEGEQSKSVNRRLELRPQDLGEHSLGLEIGDFVVVSAASPGAGAARS